MKLLAHLLSYTSSSKNSAKAFKYFKAAAFVVGFYLFYLTNTG